MKEAGEQGDEGQALALLGLDEAQQKAKELDREQDHGRHGQHLNDGMGEEESVDEGEYDERHQVREQRFQVFHGYLLFVWFSWRRP